MGQAVNKWVPYNPSDMWPRKYLATPPLNVVFSGVIGSGETKEISATNSVILNSGFHANSGSAFYAAITVTNDDIVCLPNPAQSIVLKSSKINPNIEISDSEKHCIIKDFGKIAIYPNPNRGNFVVKIDGELNNNTIIELYSIYGTLLYRSMVRSNLQNITFTESPGVYIVKVYNEGRIFTEQIILQ